MKQTKGLADTPMKNRKEIRLIFFTLIILLASPTACQNEVTKDPFYESFKNPPVEAKPVPYWWWNGNHLDEKEIIRELDILKKAGFGGIRIFPISMPENAKDIGTKSLRWLSPEWNRILKTACLGAKERGMQSDLLIGAGWPLGGEFLKLEQGIKRLEVLHEEITDGETLIRTIQALLKNVTQRRKNKFFEKVLQFVKLIPVGIKSTDEVIDLTGSIKNRELRFKPEKGEYKLVWGVLKKNFRNVGGGLEGSQGLAMDYFNKEAATDCFSRLEAIEMDLGIPLRELLDSLFCGSIELSGANWTDDITEEFEKRNEYSMIPFMPFIFDGTQNMTIEDKTFKDTIKRVRYDFNSTLVDIFVERFIQAFQEFCTKNNVLCRFQAYGHPWHYGMSEGYLVPDIPEGNNWIFSLFEMMDDRDYFNWSKIHGDLVWNKYASSGGHLKGRKIISCEAMTNTTRVFKTTLEDIKLADDMNFITGINHSVLHGFNYSPPEAGFPGWLKFGTYFSEYNTWWPYVKYWIDYNARLSYVFQDSHPVIDIAILGPTADIWSTDGFERVAFHSRPWYLHELWEPISQCGSSCDYVNEKVIQNDHFNNNTLCYGPMAYKALILADVTSIQPETAQAIEKYAQQGGTVLFIGQVPNRSPSYRDAEESDQTVQSAVQKILTYKNAKVIEAPDTKTNLLDWTINAMKENNIVPSVNILNPQQGVYQIFHKTNDKEIVFFTNTFYKRPVTLEVVHSPEKTPYKWNPETGERKKLHFDGESILLRLKPLESLLLVWDQDIDIPEENAESLKIYDEKEITSDWNVTFEHINGQVFERNFEELTDLTNTSDTALQTFAGTITYSTSFALGDRIFTNIDLGEVHKAITEVKLNGNLLGCRWYGKHIYEVSNLLRKGDNTLEIKYVTTLANYCQSLKDNPTAMVWASQYEISSTGLVGPVRLLNTRNHVSSSQ